MSLAWPDRKGQASADGRDVIDAQLHWQSVAICLDHRRYGLKTIERHRLNQFIALHRTGQRISKAQRYAVMQVIAVCKARRKTLPPERQTLARHRRAGRKRAPRGASGGQKEDPTSGKGCAIDSSARQTSLS